MKKYYLAWLIILVLLTFAVPARCQTETESLQTLEQMAAIIAQHYVEPVTPGQLWQGADRGLSYFARKYHLAYAPQPPVTDDASFKSSYSGFSTANPGMNTEEALYAAVAGMLASLKDPYSIFLTSGDFKALLEQMQDEGFGGIGIYIDMDEKTKFLRVAEIMEDTPAAKAGLHANDLITAINGVSTYGISAEQAQTRIRGQIGSQVELTVKRSQPVKKFTLKITREEIRRKALTYKILNPEIGYLRLQIFGEETGKELRRALDKFRKAGISAYILDLRDNGGGYVNAALETCSLFLPTGSKVVSVKEQNFEPEYYYSLPNLNHYKPLLVLVNNYSASASEITAAALQENRRAGVLGSKTYGKASVQKIFALPGNCALKLTIARYLTPQGKDLNHTGLYPDQIITAKTTKTDKDPVLHKALASLKTTLAVRPTVYNSRAEIYRSLEKSCGKYKIISSTIFIKNHNFYERLQVRKLKDNQVKEYYFNLDRLFPD